MRKIILFLLLLPFSIAAQDFVVKGTVLEKETKQPIPGASVSLKGTPKGAITDFDGKFEIMAKKGDKLVVSFIGVKTTEIVVSSSKVEVFLEQDISQLDEVIINTGYFDVSKKDLSGAITQVKSEQLEKNRTTSIEKMLQGQVAGVVVSESSEPGGGIAVSIRGTNSMLGGTQPLYVIDGIILHYH